MKITFSNDVSLPRDAVTQAIAILAKRRVGKSYTMRRMVEQFLDDGQQIVLVDPKGDQWGIRSSADGKKAGYPVLILGGEHGDLPLEASAGETIANLVVQERVSVLLDISLFSKGDVARFMAAFLENLYRLKAQEQYRTPVMLVIDEADAIAPQKPQKGEERMLGAANDIVRRGGQRGIGCTLVTQRSAVLNKNVLTQCELLIVLRTVAPQDLAAMKAWIDVHGTDEQGKELMESLPSLPIGDAWFWSPGWPTDKGIFQRTHVLPIKTFDSGATPKVGEKKIVPKNMADVDLNALKNQMAATIETAKQNDPKALKAEVARLTKALALETDRLTDAARQVEAPMGVSQWREYGKERGYWDYFEKQIRREAGKEWEKVVKDWKNLSAKYVKIINDVAEAINVSLVIPADVPPNWVSINDVIEMVVAPGEDIKKGQLVKMTPEGVRAVSPRPDTIILKTPEQVEAAQDLLNEPLKEGARILLTALVSRAPIRFTRSQLALVAKMSPKSSSYTMHLATLKNRNLIEFKDDKYSATQAGLELLGESAAAPQSPRELQEMWRSNLKEGQRKILDVLITNYPGTFDKEQLALEAGMSPTSSSYVGHLAVLRSNGLIEVTDGQVKAAELLF